MSDINRLPVQNFVLHHAVTPLWSEKSKPELAKFFSDSGYARAYGSNPANWSGLINPYTGERSYSQAHLAGQQVTAATPDATPEERQMGFRWVELVQDIWGQICWHAGNWEFNRSSIAIEMLGDYRNYTLRDWDARVLGAFWRPQDVSFGGATAIYGHKEVSDSSTECPARIMEMRDTIVNYCNNPPAPVHVPVITTKSEAVSITIPFKKITITDDKSEIDSIVPGVNGKQVITYAVTFTDGVQTNRVIVSDITTPVIDEVTTLGTYVAPVVVPPLVPPTPLPQPTFWNKVLAWIVNYINKKFGGK